MVTQFLIDNLKAEHAAVRAERVKAEREEQAFAVLLARYGVNVDEAGSPPAGSPLPTTMGPLFATPTVALSVRQMVADAVSKAGAPVSPTDVQQIIQRERGKEIDRSTINSELSRAVKRGEVSRADRGRYGALLAPGKDGAS